MNLQFNTQLTAKDLYRFNMRNAYTSTQGILSIICAALVVFVFIWRFDRLTVPYMILFIILAIVFIIYIPVSLWLRSNQVFKNNEIFKEPLTYSFTDEDITVTSPSAQEEEAHLRYDDIYKVVVTKGYILIYTNRISAYIIPRGFDDETKVMDFLTDKVDNYKLRGVR